MFLFNDSRQIKKYIKILYNIQISPVPIDYIFDYIILNSQLKILSTIRIVNKIYIWEEQKKMLIINL